MGKKNEKDGAKTMGLSLIASFACEGGGPPQRWGERSLPCSGIFVFLVPLYCWALSPPLHIIKLLHIKLPCIYFIDIFFYMCYNYRNINMKYK